ncbi:MAG: glycosyltransferase [Desulfovibrio sp.]|jgi:glycosyltransferase involved in cell wall biosynthesis|nr:glycosyltransferase [Desulfovibrio sp.]
MRIGFVIWSLFHVKGGLERLGANLAHAMRERGHECIVFHQGAGVGCPLYPLPDDVKTVDLALDRHHAGSLRQARRRLLEQMPDALCAMFSWDDLLWFPALCNNTGIPLLISEHSVPGVIERERWNRYERLACMAGADSIHLLNRAFLASLPDFLKERATVIPNPAEPPAAVDWKREDAPRKRLLAAGRLEDGCKQFSLLIQAFALLAPAFPDWDLRVCGDGGDRGNYASLLAALGLAQRVSLPGRIDDMDAEYASAHLFCVPSRYEGFGLAAVEAQRFALPAVGFAQCAGVNEIVVHGENGILAPEMNAQNLAASLRVLMKDAALRRRMGERGQELLARYAPEKIYGQWEDLLVKTASAKNRTKLRCRPPSERERVELALREVLCRARPFAGPASEGYLRDIDRQAALPEQAAALFQREKLNV